MLNIKENFDVIENMVISYLVTDDSYYTLATDNNEVVDRMKLVKSVNDGFFDNEVKARVFKIIKSYQVDYGRLPSTHEIRDIIKLNNYSISQDELDILFSYDIRKYNPRLAYGYIRLFTLVGNLNKSLLGIMAHLKTSEIKPENIDEIYDFVRNSINTDMGIDLTDSGMGLDIFDAGAHIQPHKSKKSTGFPFLDKVLDGGWEPKTLIVFMGRPKVGKSMVLGNIAVRGAKLGSNVGVFTVELGDRKYMKRLGANLLDIPNSEYSKFVDDASKPYIQRSIDAYRAANPGTGSIHVKEFPTGSVSPIDMENYFLKYQEMHNMHLDLVVVDYINLLKPHKGSETMYEKIKNMSEQLRAIAQRNNWCIVTATQVKVKDFSTELHMDSAAESSGLIATVDSMFGLMGEPGSSELTMKNLANRDAGYMESYKKYTKDQNHFRITEKTESDSEFYSDDFAGNLMEQIRQEDAERRSAISEHAAQQAIAPVDPQLIESFNTIGPNMEFYSEAPIAVPVEEIKEESDMQINPSNPVEYAPVTVDVSAEEKPILVHSKAENMRQLILDPSSVVLPESRAWQPIAGETSGLILEQGPIPPAEVSVPETTNAADMVMQMIGTPDPPTRVDATPVMETRVEQPEASPPQALSMDDMLNNALGIGANIPVPKELESRVNISHDDILKKIKV